MQINQDFHAKDISWIYVVNDESTKYCPPIYIDSKHFHPRVALKFTKNNSICPYCSVKFRIKK